MKDTKDAMKDNDQVDEEQKNAEEDGKLYDLLIECSFN